MCVCDIARFGLNILVIGIICLLLSGLFLYAYITNNTIDRNVSGKFSMGLFMIGLVLVCCYSCKNSRCRKKNRIYSEFDPDQEILTPH